MRFFKQMTIVTMPSLKQYIFSAVIALILSLTACAEFPGVYKVKVEQGNIVTKEMVDQLALGQTKEQVTFILGNPLIKDTFSENRWDYVYRVKHDDKYISDSHLIVYFENGVLSKFEQDNIPDIKR